MKFTFYKPYAKYEIRFKYAKKRKLLEFEAIILTIIYIQKSQNPNYNLIDLLLGKMNLEPKKWNNFLQKIISKMNNKEIQYNDNINFDELLLGDININHAVQKNIDNDSFNGLDEKELVLDKQFIIDFNNFKLLEFQDDYISLDLSSELKKIYKENSKKVNDFLDNWFNKEYKFEMLKEIEIKNVKSNENIVFFPISFESSIDFNNKIIKIDNKDFYGLYEKSEEYNFKEQMFNNLQQEINKIIEPNELEFSNIVTNILEYENIIDLIKKYNEFDFYNYRIIIYKGNIVKIGVKYYEFWININFYKTNFPIITYKNLDESELKIIWNEKYKNANFKEKIYDNLENKEQKEFIKKFILSNYKENFFIPSYKSIIIDNIDKIQNFDITWIFSASINLNEFQQIYKNIKNPLEMLKNIKNYFKCSSNDKINFLYNDFSISYTEFLLENNEIININEIKSKIDILLKINNINDFNNQKQNYKIDSLLNQEFQLNENKKYLNQMKKNLELHTDKLIRNEKNILVNTIYQYVDEYIKGDLDEYLSTKCNDKTIKENGKKFQYCIENKIIEKKYQADFDWIINIRNKFAHTNKENWFQNYLKKDINDLNNIYNRLKKIKVLMEK